MATPEVALTIATQAHEGQTDRGGHPYILHPMRVAESVDTGEERIVALLHDVIEDSDWTAEDLRARGFSEEVLEALECLTKQKGEEYEEYLARVGRNELATTVKLADLKDNMDLSRIPNPSLEDKQRWVKYRYALYYLEAHPEKRERMRPPDDHDWLIPELLRTSRLEVLGMSTVGVNHIVRLVARDRKQWLEVWNYETLRWEQRRGFTLGEYMMSPPASAMKLRRLKVPREFWPLALVKSEDPES